MPAAYRENDAKIHFSMSDKNIEMSLINIKFEYGLLLL